jgi:hypothetical protein
MASLPISSAIRPGAAELEVVLICNSFFTYFFLYMIKSDVLLRRTTKNMDYLVKMEKDLIEEPQGSFVLINCL